MPAICNKSSRSKAVGEGGSMVVIDENMVWSREGVLRPGRCRPKSNKRDDNGAGVESVHWRKEAGRTLTHRCYINPRAVSSPSTFGKPQEGKIPDHGCVLPGRTDGLNKKFEGNGKQRWKQ
jgi:hypothetical protein